MMNFMRRENIRKGKCVTYDSKRKGKLHTYVNMQKTCVLDSALKLKGKQTVTTLDVQEIWYFKDLQ
jgi:hypothetical protein